MALINTAAHLARRGRRVLAIDLDLEAPGISYLSAEHDGEIATAGFVDAIYDLLHAPEKSPLLTATPSEAISTYIRPLDLKALAQGEDSGVISIMPAGRLTNVSDYQRRLAKIDFARLYREGVGVRVLERFKGIISESKLFDYVLVDSRTGLSTESGIAVRDLADHLIVVMGLNHQNVTGTVDFLKLIQAGDPRPKTMTPVLSPMPLGEDDLAEARIATAEKLLRDAWPDAGIKSLATLQIPYHPRLALEETPHIARLTTQSLTQAYKQLERHIRTIAHDTPDDYLQKAQRLISEREWSEAVGPIRELMRFEYPSARLILQQVLQSHSGLRAFDPYAEMLREFAGDAYEAALATGAHYADSGRRARAEKVMRQFIAGHPNNWMAWNTLAQWWLRKAKRPAKADRIYSEGISHLPNNAGLRGNYGIFLWHACSDASRAQPEYEFAVKQEPDDPRTLGNYALFLWTAFGAVDKASEYFQLALEKDPLSGNTNSNFAELLLAKGNIRDAERHLRSAWDQRDSEHSFVAMETLFRAGLLCLVVNRSDVAPLRQLASKLKRKFEGEFVTFDRLLDETASKVSPEDHRLYCALADVLSRKSLPSSLRQFARWRTLRPLAFQQDLFAEPKRAPVR
jgi:Tfp pilus assembly protein PilF/cellulose biosynthesis protein BcsQ